MDRRTREQRPFRRTVGRLVSVLRQVHSHRQRKNRQLRRAAVRHVSRPHGARGGRAQRAKPPANSAPVCRNRLRAVFFAPQGELGAQQNAHPIRLGGRQIESAHRVLRRDGVPKGRRQRDLHTVQRARLRLAREKLRRGVPVARVGVGVRRALRQKQDPPKIRRARVLQTKQKRRCVARVGPAVEPQKRVPKKRAFCPVGALLRALQPVLQNAPPPLDLLRLVAALRTRQHGRRPRARQSRAGKQLL